MELRTNLAKHEENSIYDDESGDDVGLLEVSIAAAHDDWADVSALYLYKLRSTLKLTADYTLASNEDSQRLARTEPVGRE